MTEEHLDPFGDDEQPQAPEPGYSIATGSPKDPDTSEEAQGRRAYRHLRRVRQVERLKATKRGLLAAEVEQLEADLAKAKTALAKLDQWADERSRTDRMMLWTWRATAAQFTDPDQPRNKTVDFAEGLAIASETKTKPAQITLADEPVVQAQFPDFVVLTPKLEWARLKKTFTITDQGVVSEDGELVEGVYATPKHSEEVYFVLIDGKRIPLQGGQLDEPGTADGTVHSVDADASSTDIADDPFGDDA